MRLIAIFLFILSSNSLADDFCKSQLPFGTPKVMVDWKTNTALLCKTAYATLNDMDAKIPVWTAYVLTPEHAVGCEKRSNDFDPDPSVPIMALPNDYDNSGYDRGHLANDADMSWDKVVERESFLMTNMAPQTPKLNRGAWKRLEVAIRHWSVTYGHSYLIYAGPIYSTKEDKKIGKGVVVPQEFFKIVIDLDTKESVAFVMKQYPNTSLYKDKQKTIEVIENMTALSFPVPEGVDKEKMYPIWFDSSKEFNKVKKNKCQIKN